MTVTVTGLPAQYREMAAKGWNAGFDELDRVLESGVLRSRGRRTGAIHMREAANSRTARKDATARQMTTGGDLQ